MNKPSDDETTERFLANILGVWPIERWCDRKTIVAVSGGPDSVALLLLLQQILAQHDHAPHEHLTVAHFNHQTRGQESNDEQMFVESLATKLELPFLSGNRRNSESSESETGESEESLRNQRYAFLIAAGHRTGANYIATGHHRNDQVETVLFRAIRGTGLAGLAGIPTFRPMDAQLTLVRPLIQLPRESLCRWLQSIGQSSLRDSSNDTNAYARNYLRNETLPNLRERFGPHVDASIASLADQASELKLYLDSQCEPLLNCFEAQNGALKIDCRSLRNTAPLLVKHCLIAQWAQLGWPMQAMKADKWNQLAKWITGKMPSGNSTISLGHLPGKIEAFRTAETLHLRHR